MLMNLFEMIIVHVGQTQPHTHNTTLMIAKASRGKSKSIKQGEREAVRTHRIVTTGSYEINQSVVVVVVKENLIFYPPQRTARALKGAQWDVMYRPPSAFALRTGRSAERSPNNGFSTHLFDQTSFTRRWWWCRWCRVRLQGRTRRPHHPHHAWRGTG